ncbi:mycofactocin-associated electron transfer flavoprotein beta subunit [Actinosynnema sp. NPDC002837]
MLVVAALRRTETHASVDPLTGRVRRNPRTGGLAEADRCALEHAVRLASALPGARAVAVTLGPPGADDVLRLALEVGVDEVLRVDHPAEDDHTDDGSRTAAALLAGLRAGPGVPDVVLCGDRSADRGTGTTPAFLAGLLGARQALGLCELDLRDGELHGVRRLDGGRRERLRIGFPAVCSVEPGAVRLRRGALPAVLAARQAVIPVVSPGVRADHRVTVTSVRPYRPRPRVLPAASTASHHERILALSGPTGPKVRSRVVTPGTPQAAADELLAFLREHGYLP